MVAAIGAIVGACGLVRQVVAGCKKGVYRGVLYVPAVVLSNALFTCAGAARLGTVLKHPGMVAAVRAVIPAGAFVHQILAC